VNNSRYDVVILGGGNAGIGATVDTRKAGLSVALIESWILGGTCPNRGCTPKKVLAAAGHSLHEIERAKAHCITTGKPRLDWAALIDREKEMISRIPKSLAKLMDDRGVEVIKGSASFAGPDAVAVDGRTLQARHIVIATGSRPRALPIPGAEHMIVSDDVLDERTLPGEVVFVGGGVIAFEFAHVYTRAGSKVTVLEVLPRPLAGFDADAVDRIVKESERIGIDIHAGVKVDRIERSGGRFRVIFEHGGNEMAVAADRVVNGAGRVPNVEGLALDKGNVAHKNGRIVTDEFLRSTSNPNVLVCGDVLTTSPQLSPIATYEGGIAGRNIVEGAKQKPDYASIPSCVYTTPALANVGLTEKAARDKGIKVRVHNNDMLDWLSSRTFAETVAWSKILVDESTDQILGAHIVGHQGEELIHFFALAMKHAITASDIRDTVYGFPTYSADIKSMV
jgi:glutathione reductase (NADPH)